MESGISGGSWDNWRWALAVTLPIMIHTKAVGGGVIFELWYRFMRVWRGCRDHSYSAYSPWSSSPEVISMHKALAEGFECTNPKSPVHQPVYTLCTKRLIKILKPVSSPPSAPWSPGEILEKKNLTFSEHVYSHLEDVKWSHFQKCWTFPLFGMNGIWVDY